MSTSRLGRTSRTTRTTELAPAPYSYLSALTCGACGERADPDAVQGLCPAGGLVLFAIYDLQTVESTHVHAIGKSSLA